MLNVTLFIYYIPDRKYWYSSVEKHNIAYYSIQEMAILRVTGTYNECANNMIVPEKWHENYYVWSLGIIVVSFYYFTLMH